MRKLKNRIEVSTLFVLGAGASKGLTEVKKANADRTTPLDIEFTKRIENIQTVRNHKWIEESRKRVIDKFLYHVDFNRLGLERAISQQIADLDFLKSINPRRGNSSVSAITYLEDITHLISYVLSKARLNDKALAQKLIDKFFNYSHPEQCPNRIITFNYDTIIDNLLLQKYKKPEYVYFDSILPNRITTKSTVSYKFPLLLKLHGSTNWKCSTQDFRKIFKERPLQIKKSRTLTYDTKECFFIEKIWMDKKIEAPKNSVFPLIIPPIPNKPITNVAIFKYLWSYAFEYLSDCKEIVVSGYSLPETDTLATSLFSKFKNIGFKKMTIIDPSPMTISKWVTLLTRKDCKLSKIEYYSDFNSYLKSL